jgi:hypothetical protein
VVGFSFQDPTPQPPLRAERGCSTCDCTRSSAKQPTAFTS